VHILIHEEVRADGHATTTKLAINPALVGLYMPSASSLDACFIFPGYGPSSSRRPRALDGQTTRDLLLADPRGIADPPSSSCLIDILYRLWTWRPVRATHSVLVQDPPERRWPVRWGHSRGNTPRTSMLGPGSLVIHDPLTLIVFLIFQRQFVSALLRAAQWG